MAKYTIWNKKDSVITPIGEVLSAEDWIARYPVAKILDTVVFDGAVNGGFFGVYDQMKQMYEQMGVDFSACKDKQDVLNAIEAYEDAQNNATFVDDNTRIADALEDLVVLQLADVE